LRSADDRPSRHTRRHSNPSRLVHAINTNGSAATSSPLAARGVTPQKSKSQPFFEPQTMPVYLTRQAAAAVNGRKVTGLSTTRLDKRKSRGRRSSDNEDNDDDQMDVDNFQPRALQFESK